MYLMPAATRSDVTVLSPVCPRQAGAQTFCGVSTDRERFGGTGAEHHGRFDESDRAVHNNVACLLLLHKATTAPASSLLGPQDAGAVVLARASQAKWRRSCFTSTAMSRRAVRQSPHVLMVSHVAACSVAVTSTRRRHCPKSSLHQPISLAEA